MEIFISNNGKYYMTVTPIMDNSKTGKVTVYSVNEKNIVNQFISSYELGGDRATISNDGKLIATAAYSHNGLELRNIEGQIIWKTYEIKKIQGMRFSANHEYLYVWNEDETNHTFYVNVRTGVVEKRIVASEILPNEYGSEIIFWKRNIVMINKMKITSPTFAYLTGVATPCGVCLSPVSDNLRMYDYEGNLLWISDIVTQGATNHILHLVYDDDANTIYALTKGSIMYQVDILNGSAKKIKENVDAITERGKSYVMYDDLMKVERI